MFPLDHIAGGSQFALRWLILFLGGVIVHHPWWSAQGTTGMDLNPSPSNSSASNRPRPPLGQPGKHLTIKTGKYGERRC
jgi:hypothetical protein